LGFSGPLIVSVRRIGPGAGVLPVDTHARRKAD
jgi:hypothetical protein